MSTTSIPSSHDNQNQANENIDNNIPSNENVDVAKKLESGGRIISLIRKAESKHVARHKTIKFLVKKGLTEAKIMEAYAEYYKQEKLYEITFNERPLGFSVIMDTRGKNAIVSTVQNENNAKAGMKVASRIYDVNGKFVYDMKYKDILKIIGEQQLPFYIIFRTSKKKKQEIGKNSKKRIWMER